MENKLDIKIFHDANMLTSFEKKTLIDIHPILIRNGVFHPKVIYLKGEKTTCLFVGSGNLTISGWGRNIEAFEIVDITDDPSLENQVLNFFDDVFELAGLLKPEELEKKKRKRASKIDIKDKNFVYSFSKNSDKKSLLLEALTLEDSLQVFSPYFSENLDELFEKEEFKNLKEINIVPDLIENEKIRLKKLPTIEKIKFYRFEKNKIDDKNEDSTNHSKIWISDSKYAIGSHNCTQPALYGNNFEASLVQNYKNKKDFSLDNIDSFTKIQKLETTSKQESIEDEQELKDRYSSLYKMVADYKNYTIELQDISENVKIKKILIKIPSLTDSMENKEFENLKYSKRVQVFRALTSNKVFEIFNEDNRLIFRGIIIEQNVTDKTRLVNSAETLDDIFLSFADEKYTTEAKHLETKSLDIDRDDEKIYQRKNRQTSVNYFSMFTGFRNLTKKYKEIKDDEEKLKRFCFTSASSLSVVKNIIESKKKDDDLFIYLTILEFNKLVKKQKIKATKKNGIESITVPQIKLTPADKKFINEMMK